MRNDRILACTGAMVAVSLLPLGATAWAKTKNSGIETAGVAVAIALPIAAGGISVGKSDWNGLGELAVDTGATVATAFALKYVVHEERPDHSDNQSFPSDTSALAFAPAQYLWDRYGWEYGVPAYLAASFVGYSRVAAKQHHWWDVAASAGMAWGYSALITTRYRRVYNIDTSLYATPQGAYISASYRW